MVGGWEGGRESEGLKCPRLILKLELSLRGLWTRSVSILEAMSEV